MAYFTFTQRGSLSSLFPQLYYVCRQVDPNNGGMASTIVNQPRKYEVIYSSGDTEVALFTRVLDYDISKLTRTEKYATTSYNFATVEFYVNGYYVGHNYITKTLSKTVPISGAGYYSSASFNRSMPSPVALGIVTSEGFIPSLHLMAIQPTDPNSPNPPEAALNWYAFYIIPSPSVILEVMFP